MDNSGITRNLCGLLLAGGLSIRMGVDKQSLLYNGEPLWKRLYDMLDALNIPSFISCRTEQSGTFSKYNCILDRDKGTGPLSPIRSALLAFPSKSWLVIACDMPGITPQCLENLIIHRNQAKQATSFYSEASNRPEPLLCIYESGIPFDLLHRVHSPSKLLSYLDVQQLKADSSWLININTQEEYQIYLKDSYRQG